MRSTTYAEAMNGALDRLSTTGFYLDHFFANHGPMAAEALATLGYRDEVDGWVDANIRHRRYDALPSGNRPIDDEAPRDWSAALGDPARGGDWVDLFRRQLRERPWREVLLTWWPRLVPGCAGALTHGLIRTAHAVRGLVVVTEPSDLQLDELARGLAFFATAYSPTQTTGVSQPTAADVDSALSELTAAYAGYYAATAPSQPVPLIHTITAPAAMRLVLNELPADLHDMSLRTMIDVNRTVFARFGGKRSAPAAAGESEVPDLTALAAEAVDIGDEHAIKVSEAVIRENAVRPDDRYAAAVATALELIRRR